MKLTTYIFIITLLALGGAYAFHVSAQTSPSGGLAGTPVANPSGTPGRGGQTEDPAREVLFLLNKLSGIVIKTDIFQNKAFMSLKDFGLNVSPEPYGRPNPFAPLGDNTSTPSFAEPSVGGGASAPSSTGGSNKTPSAAPKKTPAPTKAPSSGFDDLNDGFFDSEL